MCLSTSSRNTISAGAPGRPRRRLCGCRLTSASYTAARISSSSSKASARAIQGSRRSVTSSAIKPSAKASCPRRRSSMALARSPAVPRGNQQFVIQLADRLERLLELLVISKPPSNLVDLLCSQAELPRLAASIADGQHGHGMPPTAGTLWGPAPMLDDSLKQRPTHDVAADRQSFNQSCSPLDE